ncbi:uncharacterized protein MKK02DRAFT_38788 [Dioszegia hungarica]|uniref:Uncharacterized protein n=1 Tax=Dioszegia hungarica TaxID=4972 RepID=A0AA38H5M8_9TREE|nr:uncharacterized protein MKK02DRAFT_38788 [Dioszegia hungarica]KAI9634117.1 hypothetical protein MKK02DRAFT_38788 [Dioszegia hungarica]
MEVDSHGTDLSDSSSSAPHPALLDPSTPETHSYLSTLPGNLRPISPYLATLHDARLRMLSIHFRSPIRWCVNCGSLRDTSLGGSASSSVPPAEMEEAGNLARAAKKGGRSPKKSPKKSPARASPLGSNCPACGERFRRSAKVGAKAVADPVTLASLKPARVVRQTRLQAQSGTVVGGDVTPTSIGTETPVPALETTPLAVTPLEDDPMGIDTSSSTLIPLPDPTLRANPLTAPKLRYIPSTSPSPPTYVQPPPVRASPAASPGPTASGVKAEGEGAKRKKKKASGLAKLLAQSKEREEGQNGGKWGFG